MNTYDIELTVPLGIRHGTMMYEAVEGIVNGTIEILGHKTAVKGIVDNNLLIITGELKTSVRGIAYKGYGKIEEGCIQIQLKSKDSVYELTGHLQETE